MAYQLTYADRESLIQTFDNLISVSNETDEDILTAVSDWVKKFVPRFGFELVLTRDVTTLSRYLTVYQSDQDIRNIARGALLYILHQNRIKTKQIEVVDFLQRAFICSYAVHEIRTRLGDSATYNLPKLTSTEQKYAEDIFTNCLENSLLSDSALVENSQKIINDLINLSACGLFQRLQKNINYLISVIVDSSWSHDQKVYARAALSYFVQEDDAIKDSLGIVGYLDDNFIVQLAVDLIEPNRQPWLEFLDFD